MMKELDNLPAVRNIVMDEVHHYHYKKDKKDGAWLKKARQLISRNRPKDSNTEGYLWLFLDMYQKENKFATGKTLVNDTGQLS